ncbi:MAG TPA: IS66 family transposase [Rhodanobacter sp.]|nr:IS66 family transposase [Rhodanobacter sp.]
MDAAALNAITDLATLRAMVHEQFAMVAQSEAIIAERDHAVRARDIKIDKLTFELARLRRMQFGTKAESLDSGQRELFEETKAEDLAALEAELEALQGEADRPAAKQPHRHPVRRPLPAELRREITVHTPDHCDCAACGAVLVKIGEHASEKLDVVPPTFFVRRDVYPQYACPHCATIVAEPVAPAIIDRGQAAPGLLAHIAIQKYLDHLPLYRQEAIFARSGIDLSRSTLAEWMGRTGAGLQPLADALHRKLLALPILHADETPVPQLDPGAGRTKRAYLFVYAGHGWPDKASAGTERSPGQSPIVVFDYCPTRAGKHAAAFLGSWQGALMVDDYGGYKALFARGIAELGCWAHARRKFFDVHKASGSPVAKEALQQIGELYVLEAQWRALDPLARGERRQHELRPKIDALKHWLDDLQPKVLGNSGLAHAVNYTLKRWTALARVADDGRYPIGRVEMWRGGVRFGISVAVSFD